MKNIPLKINGVRFDKLMIAENYEDMYGGHEEMTSIGEFGGIAYVFDSDCKASFVNENPYFDLDVIMVDSHEMITAVHTMKKAVLAEGESAREHRPKCQEYPSPVPYRYAFELEAGMAERIGAKAGERLDVDYLQLYPFRNAKKIRYAFQQKKVVPRTDWIEPLLRRMENIAAMSDPVRDLNIEFAGGMHDREKLFTAGWILLERADTAGSKNLWFQKIVHTGERHSSARLCLSTMGHFRYLYFLCLADDGSYLPTDEVSGFGPAVQVIRPDLVQSQIRQVPQSIEDELKIFSDDLENPSVKPEWNEKQKKLYIWSRDFSRMGKISRYLKYRMLNGMLRFEDFCTFDCALCGPLCTAADLGYRWAMAKLVILSLTHASDSSDPGFWNDLGYALDRLDEKEAAFYCFANAWNLTLDVFYANNLWLMGKEIIPAMLKKQDLDPLFSVVSMMLSAISDKATVKDQLEVLCIVGLIYEKRGDFSEADDYYYDAYDIYKRNGNNDKSLFAMRQDFPVLFQSLMRHEMDDKKLQCAYAEEQLKVFPLTPLEAGYAGRLPVEYVEGDGHGDHWDSMVARDRIEDAEKFFSTMIRNGKMEYKGIEIPDQENGKGGFKRGIGFRYSAENESVSPVFSCFIVGEKHNAEAYEFVSAFPAFRKGCGSSVICTLRNLSVWENAVEATAEIKLLNGVKNSLAFYLPDYCREFPRLKPDTAYRVELGAFAYVVRRFEKREFKIDKGPLLAMEKLRLHKEGKDDNIDSVSVFTSSDFCNISRNFNGCADDISVTAPVERIDNFSFYGSKCLALWLKFDERGANMTLPVFLREDDLDDGYSPKVGDVVECSCWLQGWVHESHGSNHFPESLSEEIDDEDELDLKHSLLSGIRGTDCDLEAFALVALEQKVRAERIFRCPDPMPGEADLSCRIKGAVRFVKIMTGFFENEDECRAAWAKFCRRVVSRPDGEPVHLISVVGVKVADDYYKIYYNGFSQLDPEKGIDENELDLRLRQDARPAPGEIAGILARAWKDLETEGIREILSEDYEYNSLQVMDTMYGAEKYLHHLAGKFERLRNENCKPVVCAVRSDENYVEIELKQSVKGKTNTSMLQFELLNGKIISGWMCDPSFRRVK